MGISTSIGFYDFLNYLTIGAILSFILVPWIPQSAEALALWAIPCFVAGLIFHKIVENTIGKCTRNNKELILSAFKDKANFSDKKIEESIDIRREYYRAYYSLLEKKQLGNIPELEAISSFLQDLFCIALLYVITVVFAVIANHNTCDAISSNYWCYTLWGVLITLVAWCLLFFVYFNSWIKWIKNKYKTAKCIFVFLVLASFVILIVSKSLLVLILAFSFLSLLPFLRIYTEMKIYGLVWEGYIFMHLNKKDIIN